MLVREFLGGISDTYTVSQQILRTRSQRISCDPIAISNRGMF